MSLAARLKHCTIYEDQDRIAVKLPYIPELQAIHPDGNFSLLEDPLTSSRTSILGMVVLRPRDQAWTKPVLCDGQPMSFYNVKHWIYDKLAAFTTGRS